MTEINVIDRLFGALETGDRAAVSGCFAPDGGLWHSFDRVVMTEKEVEKSFEAMILNFSERKITDINRQRTATGFVQQHLMTFTSHDGQSKSWPVCIVVQVKDGLIMRLDEYIDRAGWF
jgi:ketosteroid isomerase-like protein